MMRKLWIVLAMLVCVFASCSDGGSEELEPTPKPDVVIPEITIDSNILTNGLSFGTEQGEASVSFSTNVNWTLTVSSTSSGTTWCKASVVSGNKGTATVKFTVTENTSYEDRSVSVTIKAGTLSKTFTITQKGVDALLVTTNKYELSQEGGQIEIEVKANIEYQMQISETAKSWITEVSSRALTTYKHKLDIAMNESVEKREGEITFKSGDKVETVKVYQTGGAIIMLTQNEYIVSDAGEMITVDIKSNVEFGVQMPDVDWIVDEASSRGMSSHTLNYYIEPNEGYDSRSAEIIFFDKNSDLKDTLTVVQAQKDAIVISEKNFDVSREGGTIEVKVNTNVDFEVQIPSDVTWISQTSSRALSEETVYLKVSENVNEESRSANITIVNKDSQLSEMIVVTQQGNISVVTLEEAGTLKTLLGKDYLNIKSLKIIGPINGDDVYYLRKMLGGRNFNEADWGKLTTLDLSEASVVEGGEWYYKDPATSSYGYTSNDVISEYMFSNCVKLQRIILPNNVVSISKYAFKDCQSLSFISIPQGVTSIGSGAFSETALRSIIIPEGVTSIGGNVFGLCRSLESIIIPKSLTTIGYDAFRGCVSLQSVYIEDLSSWCRIDFGNDYNSANPLDDGARLYLNGKELKELVIPDDITSVKINAFKGCGSITKVIISDNVTSIGKFAFWGNDSLKTVSIGKGVESIGYGAFTSDSLICYCYATTPPKIYYFSSNSPEWAFYGEIKGSILYVPVGCYRAYHESYWKSRFEKIVEMEE